MIDPCMHKRWFVCLFAAALAAGCTGELSRSDTSLQPGGTDSSTTGQPGGGLTTPSPQMEEDDGGSVGGTDRGEFTQDMDPIEPIQEGCVDTERDFVRDVWARVLVPKCQSCHNASGIATNTRFVLVTPEQNADHMTVNRDTVEAIAALRHPDHGETPLMLLKAAGVVPHGGGAVLAEDSASYQRIDTFLQGLGASSWCPDPQQPAFAQHLQMWPAQALLRRITLDLAGRLPSAAERMAVGDDREAITPLLDELMREPRFLDIFVDEGLNDVFYLRGADINAARLDGTDFPDHEWYTDIGPARGRAHRRAR